MYVCMDGCMYVCIYASIGAVVVMDDDKQGRPTPKFTGRPRMWVPTRIPQALDGPTKQVSFGSLERLRSEQNLGEYFQAVFRSKRQNSKTFINHLHGVLNIVEKNCIT